jgi:hypothetical protein
MNAAEKLQQYIESTGDMRHAKQINARGVVVRFAIVDEIWTMLVEFVRARSPALAAYIYQAWPYDLESASAILGQCVQNPLWFSTLDGPHRSPFVRRMLSWETRRALYDVDDIAPPAMEVCRYTTLVHELATAVAYCARWEAKNGPLCNVAMLQLGYAYARAYMAAHDVANADANPGIEPGLESLTTLLDSWGI